MWLFISIIWSNDARLISFVIYTCKLASCRVGRTPCDFLVQLLSFINGFVFVSACKVTVSTCSWRWLHTQMFPCCVVPPNMVLDKSQMGRGERIVYRLPAWRCYSSIWSEDIRRNQRRTVPQIMTLNIISVLLFPFLWFIMLFQKHGATVRSVWWVRKSFQWPRTIQNKFWLHAKYLRTQTSDSLLSLQASWSSSASGARWQRFVSSPPEAHEADACQNKTPHFMTSQFKSVSVQTRNMCGEVLWRNSIKVQF